MVYREVTGTNLDLAPESEKPPILQILFVIKEEFKTITKMRTLLDMV